VKTNQGNEITYRIIYMKNSFRERYGDWALVTGATSGIGAEIALQIAAKGLNVILVARNEDRLSKQAKYIHDQYAVETKYISADLSTPEGMEKVSRVDEDIGLLVASAALETDGPLENTPLEHELKMLQINTVSTLYLTHHFGTAMVERKRGGILLVSSLAGHMVNPYFSNYAGSKAYVLQFGASLYGEFKRKGVDVSVLSPGLNDTAMAEGANVDWSKLPMAMMAPAKTAKKGLDGLGRRFLSIPGIRNKLLVLISKYSPLGLQAVLSERLIRRAVKV
jgi:uncharacterized protein